MQPRLTTIALTTLALTTGALAQVEPLTCAGPGATHDRRLTLQPLDAIAAAATTPHDAIATAQLLLQRGNNVDARTELMRSLTSTPPEERASLYFLLGVVEARLGSHQAAANAFASVQPATFASRYNQAIARAQAGDHATAQTTLQELLADTLEAHHGVTNLEALPEATQFAEDTQAAVNLILTTAATLHYMNQTPADAVTTLEQLLKVTPRTPALTHLQVSAAIDFLPSDGAVLYTQRHADGQTRDLLLARAYAKVGMHEYAQQHYAAATQTAIDTRDATALTEIAAYHATNDHWLKAASAAREAIRINPTNHLARSILALELENQGRHADAAQEHQQALAHGANPISTCARLAANHEAAGDHQAAITAAETALEAANAHPATSQPDESIISEERRYALLALLARNHQALGETPEALAYATAAAHSPLAGSDMHAYAGDLAMLQGDPHAALTHYANTKQDDPLVARATYHAHLQLEQYEQARDAASHLPEAGETLHLIAWAYALEGDTSAAHQAWQRAAQTQYAPAKQILARLEKP